MIYIVDTNNKTFYLTPENINFFFKKNQSYKTIIVVNEIITFEIVNIHIQKLIILNSTINNIHINKLKASKIIYLFKP